jgi:steroid 5-alpha reductase family enzyme
LTFAQLTVRTVIALAIGMFVWWIASVIRKDASIVDIFWGVGYVLVAGAAWHSGGYRPRQILVAVLVAIWGSRLAIHLAVRNLPHGEDPRYQAMRRRRGASFWWISLFTVFAFQLVLLWVVSLPIQVAMHSSTPTRLTVLDFVGAGVWLVGFVFESIGDLQLRRFKADPANNGEVMDRGLWRYTRHPNYFGDAVLWWGLGLIAVASGHAWALVGPLVMTVLLLRVSGVPLLERRMTRTRPGYEEYVRRTSAFVPMPPRG